VAADGGRDEGIDQRKVSAKKPKISRGYHNHTDMTIGAGESERRSQKKQTAKNPPKGRRKSLKKDRTPRPRLQIREGEAAGKKKK